MRWCSFRGRRCKAGAPCRKQTRKNAKGKSCVLLTKVGSFAQAGKAGSNTKRFSGRIGRTTLKPGAYQATLLATDAALNRSKPAVVAFTVIKGPKKSR